MIKLIMMLFTLVYSANALANYEDSDQLPEKPVSNLIQPLISAINSGETSEILSFIQKHYAKEMLTQQDIKKHVAHLFSIHEIQGEIDFHSSRSYERFTLPDYELHAVFKTEKTNLWLGAILVVDASPPHKLTRLEFIPARPPSNIAKASPLTLEQVVHELDAFVDVMSKMDLFSGAVLLAKGDEVLYQVARGLASKRFDIANTVETKFNLVSLNKMFTATAIMQLAAKGKLSLTDKLSKYIYGNWLNDGISDKIEIRHLLTHTSGLDNNFLSAMDGWPKRRFKKLTDYKVITKDAQQYFEPGTASRYSNTGMFLLGVVIESVSGQDYFDYVREHIYLPAGMKNTDAFEMDEPIQNLAIGYSQDDENVTGWRNNLFSHVLKGSPAGGGYSTVQDLHAFAVALTQFKLLPKHHTELMVSPKPKLKSPRYGYGFAVREIEDTTVVGHEGGTRGINSNLDIYLEQDYISAIMSNYSAGSVHVMRKIRELLARVE